MDDHRRVARDTRQGQGGGGRCGLSIRAWVDRTLNAAADESLAMRGGRSPRVGTAVVVDPKALSDVSAKLDELLKRLPADGALPDAVGNRLTAIVMRSLAGGFDDMHKAARDTALVAEGKAPKRKKKKRVAGEAGSGTGQG